MPSPYYLDAARMGLMTPSTQLALQDFVRYVGENGCTLYFERFLKEGWQALPLAEQTRYPGLRSWNGVRDLKESLARLVGTVNAPLFLAARTSKLVELAARVLFRSCRRVLLTDLTWPSYARLFRRIAQRFGREVVCVAIRSLILKRKADRESISSHVLNAYRTYRCEGLLLSHVSHDGIHLSWQLVSQRIEKEIGPAMTVIDGGQALGHVPVDLRSSPCDFYVAGCHKWMGTHLPLGIGVSPNPRSASRIELAATRLDDPLFRFLDRMEGGRANRFSETVNLAPLLPCKAALNDLDSVVDNLAQRQSNAAALIASLDSSWQPILPHKSMRAGVVLMKSTAPSVQRLAPEFVRSQFLAHSVGLTAYSNGLVRLAIPASPWREADLFHLAKAFCAVSQLSGPTFPSFMSACAAAKS